MKSKMFLNNVTVIDCAYIDNKGHLIGDSITPKFMIAGEVDEKENVVVDFSRIKKDIKDIIDHPETGFDHKLWVISGYSKCTWGWGVGQNLELRTPSVQIDAPKNAFKVIHDHGCDYLDSVMQQMVSEIEDELNARHPNTKITVQMFFSDDFTGNDELNVGMVPFRYVHGLKGSTSWGCQNIAHGHLSYISASTTSSANNREVEMLLHQIASEIDGTIFVWKDNIQGVSPKEDLVIKYFTPRGMFTMTLEGSYAKSNVIILDTETTVELLAEGIAKEYNSLLKAAGVVDLFVSEGLNKGAVVNIQGE